MTQSVHGHEVMEMMLAQGGQFTRASLKQAIDERFGAEARFHQNRYIVWGRNQANTFRTQ